MNMDRMGSIVNNSYHAGTVLPPMDKTDFRTYMEDNLRMRIEFARTLSENFTILRSIED